LQQSIYYTSDGAAYEAWLGRWSTQLAKQFLDFTDFPEAGELLDVGCGTGALTLSMAGRWPGRGVIGIDLAAPYISYAKYRRTGHWPVFEVGDACALKYEDGRFAGVTAQLVFIFIPKPEIALREMRRVTRSGGTVAAVVWNQPGGLVYQRMFFDTAVAIDPNARTIRDRMFANPVVMPGGLAGFFQEAGLVAIEERSLSIQMDYVSFEDYWRSFLAAQGPVGVYFTNLDPELKARIKAAVRDAYCSGAPDGPRSLAASAWAVRGRAP
jgi:SAM-dependent methyltransferase